MQSLLQGNMATILLNDLRSNKWRGLSEVRGRNGAGALL